MITWKICLDLKVVKRISFQWTEYETQNQKVPKVCFWNGLKFFLTAKKKRITKVLLICFWQTKNVVILNHFSFFKTICVWCLGCQTFLWCEKRVLLYYDFDRCEKILFVMKRRNAFQEIDVVDLETKWNSEPYLNLRIRPTLLR